MADIKIIIIIKGREARMREERREREREETQLVFASLYYN